MSVNPNLFLVDDLRGGFGGLNFLEGRELPELWCLWLSGAAAGGGKEREGGNGEGGDETDHGAGVTRFFLGVADRRSPESRYGWENYLEGV